ncbi:DUF4829 domain-containing protein [Clostridium sp.]|uniref:DUF4829 domain-containing protein n=1 Tax=Clostridium sp. TaxID=1506 RepID=UPI002FC71F87
MILTGCTSKNSKDKKIDVALLTPTEVIEEFLKCYNQKDLKGMNVFTTEKYHYSESSWGFDNLEYIKLINIIEDTNQENKEMYLRQMKKGQILDMEKEKSELENATIFDVYFEVKYKKEGVGPSDSGKDRYSYTLIRKDKNSPWLISSMGY